MKQLIRKNVKWFVVILIFSIIVWSSIFNVINAPKNYEKVQIFISADIVKTTDIESAILANTPLKKVEIYNCSEDDDYYEAYLQTSGIITSDILIVNKELVETEGATSSFVKLDQEIFSKYNIDLTQYEVITINNEIHAIVVYDKTKNINLLDNYITIDEENQDNCYCLVLNNISYHIGNLSMYKENITELAYEIISILVKKELSQ